jgi:hypothetical protein
MLNIHFLDWGKNRPKKQYLQLHELRIFELIFSNTLFNLGVGLGEFKSIGVYCLANPNKKVSIDEERVIGEIRILIPYDFMSIIEMETTEAKFQAFCDLVRSYILPVLEQYSNISSPMIKSYVEEALNEVVKENYEAVFLVDKTPRKSPNRKKMAILKGIHRSEGFQLRCEVYNEKGLRIINELLAEEVGNETVYARFLGTLKWENENLIIVKSKTSSWKAEVHL